MGVYVTLWSCKKKNCPISSETSQGDTRNQEEIEEGDRKEPLRFDTLEVTSFEELVPDQSVKTYDEVT